VLLQYFVEMTSGELTSWVSVYEGRILPLFRAPHFAMFYHEMSSLAGVVLKKAPRSLFRAMADRILHYFPFSSSQKAIMLMTILAPMLPRLVEGELKSLTRPLFTVLARCAASRNDALTEMAVRMWTLPALHVALYWDAATICPIAVANFDPTRRHPAIDGLAGHLKRIDGAASTTALQQSTAQTYRRSFRWMSIARTVADAEASFLSARRSGRYRSTSAQWHLRGTSQDRGG
jgi:hypothetical protein